MALARSLAPLSPALLLCGLTTFIIALTVTTAARGSGPSAAMTSSR
jgi:hypothetical protein